MIVQATGDLAGQGVVAQAQGRAVDRDAQVGETRGGQVGKVPAGTLEYPGIQLLDEAIGLGDAKKEVGRQQAEAGMIPANQGFGLVQVAAGDVEDRLVVELQTALLDQCLTQFGLQLQLQRDLLAQGLVEKAVGVAPVTLGQIERQVRALEQLFATATVAGIEADADAGGHHQRAAADGDRIAQSLQDALGEMACLVRPGEAGQDAEFVTTKAGYQVTVADRVADGLGHGHQQLVASVVTEAVIDALEVIDVEKHHRQATILLGMAVENLGEGLVEGAPIVQVGERVVVRRLLQ